MILRGSGPVLLRKEPYIFVIFQGGGGSGPPVPPLDPHMQRTRYDNKKGYLSAQNNLLWFNRAHQNSGINVDIGVNLFA